MIIVIQNNMCQSTLPFVFTPIPIQYLPAGLFLCLGIGVLFYFLGRTHND